ncbi:hypothetical protein AB1283_04505 [Bacillus sp. S13(2024)]|uniref:hypothetical protein n=1 Tax=unclassified Bacillus (in: firmicutes) TaxID=185979 RepID=UPI003D1A881D
MSFQVDSLLKTAISTVLFPFTGVNMYIRKKNATKEQQLLCQLTNCTKHIQTENGHSIQLENPEVVIKTILELM